MMDNPMPETIGKDACDLLDADHLAVKHLFVDYAGQAHAPQPSDDRATLAMRICDELTLHAQIEEEIFYPALREALPDANDLVMEAQGEHDEAKALIAQIRASTVADEALDELVAALARVIEDHVKMERDELFPKARGGQLDLQTLAEQLRRRQQEGQAPVAEATTG